MKSIFPALIIISAIIFSCSAGSGHLHGGWQLIHSENVEHGKTTITYPGKMAGSEYKFWSDKNFIFVGRWTKDSVTTDNYGYGEYTLNGKDYEETVQYHFMKGYQGKKIRMTLELVNDTIIQVYHPVDSAGQPISDISSVEKYIRLK